MNKSFKPAIGIKNLLRGNEGKGNKTLLLTLLLLVSVIGYLYLFTGLFGQGTKTSVQPQQNEMVRKPMPPRPQQTGAVKAENKETIVQQEAKPSAVAPMPVQPAQVRPAAEKQSKPAQLKAKSSAVKSAKGENQITPQAQKRPAVPVKASIKGSPAKKVVQAEKPLSAGPATTKTPVASKPEKGNFTLLIGVYVLEKSMASEKSKLKSAGLSPVISKGPKKMEPMNRLLVAEFDNRPEAVEELVKLRKLTIDAFILPGNGKYTVYAGSYFTKGRAQSEQSRLIKQGVKPVMQKTEVQVPTMKLTAGSFSSRKEAEEKVLNLKKQGINASIVQTGTK